MSISRVGSEYHAVAIVGAQRFEATASTIIEAIRYCLYELVIAKLIA